MTTKAATPAKTPKGLSQRPTEVRKRERDALELRNAGLSYEQIAERVGYADPEGARKAILRGLDRTIAREADEVRDLELSRLDALWQSVYAKARRGDTQAIGTAMRIMERRARYLGLDFSDAMDERKVVLAEAQAMMLADVIRGILDGLNLTPEQKRLAPDLVRAKMLAIDAETA